MNDQMALKLIAAVMGWPEDDDGTATREYAWLRFMSSAKYRWLFGLPRRRPIPREPLDLAKAI